MALVEALYPLTEVSRFRRRYDDDFVDRLNHRYSAFTLVVLGIVISTRQYVGDPITCWAPAHFTHEWIEYTNKVCWISNTYYVPIERPLPGPGEPRESEIAYYQWVSIIIFIQALLFFAPSVIWKKLNSQSGIHVNKIVSVVGGAEHGSPEVRDRTIRYIVRNLDRALRSQQEYRTGCLAETRQALARRCCLFCGKRYGNYLISLYLAVKALYVCNSVAQLFALDGFLGAGYHMYGIHIVRDLLQGRGWSGRESKRFPRVTMCDFDVRVLGGHRQTHTVQCALPINLFTEKIYAFIWFWLVLVATLTTLNLLGWMWTLFRLNRTQYVKKYIKIMHRNFDKADAAPSKEFCDHYLRQDGIFVLRIIANNTNDVVVGEIIQALWEHYKKHHEKQRIDSGDDV